MNRPCFRPPIPEMFQAAMYLQDAIESHLAGDYEKTADLIVAADIPEIGMWVESVIGKKSSYIQHICTVSDVPMIKKSMRIPIRMPHILEKRKIHDKYGYCCQFCGTPVVRSEVREKMRKKYPKELRWGKTNSSRHNAFFAFWAQYDHIIPHARGGDNSLQNIILTCSACNFGRMNFLLEEVGINLPTEIKTGLNGWNGLEKFI